MLLEIKVPPLSESVAEATLLSWHKKAGDDVKRDENLIDIETDKVVLELPAPHAGRLAQIVKENGATVTAGEVIALLDTDVRNETIEETPAKAEAVAAIEKPAPSLSPAARKLAEEKGIKAEDLAGSGRGGLITKEDVAARAAAQPAPAVDMTPLLGERPEQRVPMTRLRRRIAERLVQAQSTAAILTTFNEVNMQPIMELRARHKDRFEKEHGVKLGFMSFFVKAAVKALKQFPVVNASVDGDDIVYHGYYDIGIAVGTERGLVVPVLRNADRLSFAEIEAGIAEFGRKARDGKLTIEELSGGTFTLSNGGVFGSMLSTPILNPPQSAILGMHKTYDRPVAENGQVVIRPMMYLALSYDHRLIDGREAVLSLVAIKEALEDPARLLLEV